ncbi:hypothetical protein GCM10009835_46100 [Planosporangium flavigriseum]|uniref:Uncharacterized protein n=1 Tax=Planosporangium flavigriseum TaxID=373681 RepID=A0A8J3LJS8_9ACTN|nr:hypothetical protein Pfl04_02590 [Planosporangium flavigriseum]
MLRRLSAEAAAGLVTYTPTNAVRRSRMLPLSPVRTEEARARWGAVWRWFDDWTMESFNPRAYRVDRR